MHQTDWGVCRDVGSPSLCLFHSVNMAHFCDSHTHCRMFTHTQLSYSGDLLNMLHTQYTPPPLYTIEEHGGSLGQPSCRNSHPPPGNISVISLAS